MMVVPIWVRNRTSISDHAVVQQRSIAFLNALQLAYEICELLHVVHADRIEFVDVLLFVLVV